MALSRTFGALLYQVSPTDPLSLIVAGATLFMIAILACLLPALRASRIDPMVALRTE
jgi:ABC-type antimicrobial peptide transport system permease subunit